MKGEHFVFLSRNTRLLESAFSQDGLSSEGEDAMNEGIKRFILEGNLIISKLQT